MIEDSRKVLQDSSHPNAEPSTHASPLEKKFDESLVRTDRRFDDVDKRFEDAQARTDNRFDHMQKHMDQRFSDMEKRIDQGFAHMTAEIRRLADFQDLQLRMARLENRVGREGAPPVSATSEAA